MRRANHPAHTAGNLPPARVTEKSFGNTLHKRSQMETPVRIEFQRMEPEEKLHAAIARHVA